MRAFLSTVRQSIRLAFQGEEEYGHHLLLAGLALAEEAERGGDPWAPTVTGMYRRLLYRYQERYLVHRAQGS